MILLMQEVRIKFYIDIFMLLNVIMNFYLLLMTAILRQKKIFIMRIILASFLGAGIATLGQYMVILFLSGGFLLWSFRGVICLLMAFIMLWIAFRDQTASEFIKSLFALVKISVLTGGILFLLWNQITINSNKKNAGIFFLLLGSGGITVWFLLLGKQYSNKIKTKNTVLDVKLVYGKKSIIIRGLYDTGNHLQSPYTKEPVHIVSKQVIRRLGVESTQKPILIPYHSIGGDGLLKTYRIDSITLLDGETKERILVAESAEISNDKVIQIILNVS